MSTTEPTSKRLMNVAEVAAYLHVSVKWVYDHSTGKIGPELPNFKLGKYRRYRFDEIERWTNQRRNAA
jgi:predicted DNA-binding transcriptional regulator AlpA